MHALQFHLFGNLRVCAGHGDIDGIESGKARELLGYLLVHRQRTHPRETLAGQLWGDTSTSQSRKYLRQALWQLQNTLNLNQAAPPVPLLLLESDAIRLNADADIWIDIDQLERAFVLAKGVRGEDLSQQQADALCAAVDLYQGDLLEGWYQDWCIHERERLQIMYVVLLDKLMRHCEAHDAYELGLMYGEVIIGIDRAREATYRSLMRLHARAGDRTSALRQYARCVDALNQELGVEPSRQTVALVDQIRADHFDERSAPPNHPPARPIQIPALSDVVEHLSQISALLNDFARQLQQDVQTVDRYRVGGGSSGVTLRPGWAELGARTGIPAREDVLPDSRETH